ncbi:MAG: ATP-binding cassette domain-containing protein [Desulfomonile tiedjei]|uniref:ATP-binding cassette domain-containing protein n=1 Tax=Desulfomonile tiedjei TaxID=2358 RepID=A0A9D6VBW4_9BACT|nr:ATP-binding cassette domain-containing protein [Desulfomonile tiedjei]
METDKMLIQLDDVSVKIANAVILSGINWVLRSNESWAVLGGNGAGKTTFLSLVRGDIWPDPTHGKRLYCDNGSVHESPMSFRQTTGIVSPELLDRYRKERWNLSGLEVVCTGFRGTPLLYEEATAIQLDQAHQTLTLLGLEELSDRRILGMSYGEAKKVLIARAIVHKPRILFLDELDAGLDPASRKAVMATIERSASLGAQVICAAHDVEQVPSVVTRVLVLSSGRVTGQGSIEEVSSEIRNASKLKPKRILDLNHNPEKQPAHGEPIVQIENADVCRGRKRVLKQISWTVRAGENWAVLGRNGSGKSSLLKLIAGDLRPVWGGTVRRFGQGNPKSLWEIRRLIGFVTPDLQYMHVFNQSGLEMVLSGFYGSTGLPEKPTHELAAAAQYWFGLLGIPELQGREVRTLSHGQIRILMILRAVISDPKILLLDEPMSGLDAAARSDLLSVIENLIGMGKTMIYVSHRQLEVLPSITHVAVLEKGQMVFQGPKSEWQEREKTCLDKVGLCSGQPG